MVKNSILRENARKQLGGGIFKQNWLYMLVCCLIASAITGALGATGIGSIVTIIIAGPLSYGLYRVLMETVRATNEKIEIGNMFCGFKEAFGDSLVLYLLMSIFLALWSLLLVVPGIIKYYAYSMAPFLQQDSEDKNWKVNLDKSIEMMNGYKMKLFLLDLSFIGWYILGALCLGIGTLFVIPYHQMARANFYEALRAEYGMDD